MIILVIIVGLCFGSFISCVSYRLPRGENIVSKQSYCPSCHAVLTFADLWPLLSWLVSGGKCRHCSAAVSIRYPLTEICTALMFLLVYLQFALSAQSLIICLMVVALMIMIVVDLEHLIIPDSVHVAMIILALPFHYLHGSTAQEILISVVIMTSLAFFLHYVYSAIRGRVMLGFGDVKFFIVSGLWLSPELLLPFIFLSGIFGVMLGLLWRRLGKGEIFPFGPALAMALYICALYKNDINMLYIINNMHN